MGLVVIDAREFGIVKMVKGMTVEKIKDFMDSFQIELEEKYGYEIDELEQMALGLIPDITKKGVKLAENNSYLF